MADSILRLRVDSAEYDNKLKQATNGLTRYVDECRKVGGTLEVVEKETLDYVRALGQMDTTSRTATGKLAEMKKTFTELSAQYKQMTDVEKNSPFGKALAQSLDQLKTRINDSKAQLNDINKELNGSGGLKDALDQVAGKFGLNIGQLTKFGSVIGVTTTALKVAQDAFFASEQNVDEWGRIVAASESVYEGFLSAINNGDISGYLSRIDEIVEASRKAYDELDRLGTMKTIQSPQMDKQNAENIRLRTMLMTGRYIAPAAGTGLKANREEGALLSPAELKKLEKQLQNGMNTIVKLTGNELEQTGKAIDAYYNKLAKQNGMTMEEFKRGTSSMAEFDKRVEGAKKYDEWQYSHSFVDQQTGKLIAPRTGNPYAQYAGWNNFRVDKQGQNSYNDLVGLIKQQQQQTSQLYSTIGQSYKTINRAEGVTVKGLMNGGGGGSGGSGGKVNTNQPTWATGSIAAQEAEVSRLTKLWKEAGDTVRDDYALQLSYAKQQLAEMTGGFNPNKLNQIASTSVNFTAGTAPIAPDKIEFSKGLQKQMDSITQGGNNAAKSWDLAAQAVSNVGSAFASIEDPGMKAIGTVTQAIASIALGFSMASANANTAGTGWGWLAWLAAGTAAMATTISTIHSLTGYAEGGIVKGNSYSGDNIYAGNGAMVNAGELILSRSQQLAVASQLQSSSPFGGGRLVARLKGADLLLSIERELAVTGKGELATFK